MARKLTPSYTDDLSHVAGVTLATVVTKDEKGNETEAPAQPGSPLSASQRVSVVLTQGEHVYILDTAQSNALAALIRSAGVKQAKRGRKAAA